jgi:predicted TIM-barrel fold metal-dependent hydrolase
MVEHRLPVFDADAHVYEQDDEVAAYIEGKWANMERVRTFGLFPSLDGWNRSFLVPGVDTHTDVEVWREMLGELGAEGSVLYPTAGLAHGLCQDPEWAADLATAYNNWLEARYTALDERLYGVGLMAVQDPKQAVAELERCVGQRTRFVAMMLPSRNSTGRSYGDEFFFPIYEAAERHDIALGVHGGPSQGMGFDHLRPFIKVHGLEHPLALFIQLTDIVLSGVFEAFPRLRIAFLEAGSSWVPFMMDRLDYEYDFMPHRAPRLSKRPSDYFRDGENFWVSCEIDEMGLKYCIDAIGSERIVFASDYPHERTHGEFAGDVPKFLANPTFDDDVKRRILHDNAKRLYRIS